jgi:mutator family transposase
LRNSFKYAGRQHWDQIAKALKPVYTAPTEAAAEQRFLEFAETWGDRYPAIVRLWENAWAEFVPFLAFDAEIRKVVCSTNASVRGSGTAGAARVVPPARAVDSFAVRAAGTPTLPAEPLCTSVATPPLAAADTTASLFASRCSDAGPATLVSVSA